MSRLSRGSAIPIFLSMIVLNTDQCVVWKHGKRSGYGSIFFNGTPRLTHILSWELTNHRSVPEACFVTHSCNTRACINPKHLSLRPFIKSKTFRQRSKPKCSPRQALTVLGKLIKKKTDNCIIWPLGKTSTGYGAINFNGMASQTNIVAWTIANNRAVPEGLHVRHTCDTRLCINPRHLIIGTHQDNMNDMAERKRNTRGEDRHNAKLTEDQVKVIREDRDSKLRQMATKFGVAISTIHAARIRKRWKHVA